MQHCLLWMTGRGSNYFIDKRGIVLYDPPLSNSSQVEQMCSGVKKRLRLL
jgi:hypothetical protein